MGWISSIFGVGRPVQTQADPALVSAMEQALRDDLALLAQRNSDLPGLLVQYVLTGEGEAALARVAGEATRMYRLNLAQSAATSGPQGRRLFFYHAAGHDIALTARYLRVLAAAAGAPPEGLTEVQATLDLAVKSSQMYDPKAPDDPVPDRGMTRATLESLARALGGDGRDVLKALTAFGGYQMLSAIKGPVHRLAEALDLAADLAAPGETMLEILGEIPFSVASPWRGGTHGAVRVIPLLWKFGLLPRPGFAAFFADRIALPDRAARSAALGVVKLLPRDLCEALLIQRLDRPDARLREAAAERLADFGSAGADAALRDRLAVEKAGAVRRVIEAHLAGQAMVARAARPDDETGYTAAGGAWIAIPPPRDFIPGERPVFGEAERLELVALIEADNARRLVQREELMKVAVTWKPGPFKPIDHAHAAELIARLNGTPPAERLPYSSEFGHLLREGAAPWYRRQLRRLPQEAGLREHSGDLTWLPHGGGRSEPATTPLLDYLQAPNADLRRIEALAIEKKPSLRPGCLLARLIGGTQSWERRNNRSGEFARDAVWPLMAANLAVIDDALSTAPKTWHALSRTSAILWLELLPATPQRFIAPLLDIATAPRRESRAEARRLLAQAPGLDAHLIALLQDSRQEARRGAAEWLGDRRAAEAEPALRARLKVEKAERARAAMITALARIGADISAHAGPAALVREAEAGLRGTDFAPPAWLALGTLGPLRWRDGSPLPAAVLHWWIRLALRLKQPGGNGMLALYLDQLHPADAQALGRLILDAWLAESTRTTPQQDAWRGEVEVLENQGAEAKGILALARAVPAGHAAARVRWFLKHRGGQASLACALLELLAAKGDPQSLQVVLAASVRQKQKSVRKLAGALVDRIADDNDWTLEQLADRTAPDLGLDETGVLDLPCGAEGRLYTARLDERTELRLFNPEGRPVKALPAAEDPATAEAKQTLAEAKKTLAQAARMQGERLFDAMASGRVWAAADWLADIAGHPLLRRLAERLVWLGLDDTGAIRAGFRPTPEGDVIDLSDAPVDPAGFAGVRLAHSTLLDPAADAAWAAHLTDYEVAPLFAQFGRALPAPAATEGEGDALAERLGWVSDTFTVRVAAKKLGYDRGETGDGGHFDHYLRRFPQAGLVAVLNFSGNCLPEENLPAVIHDLRFARDRDGKPGAAVRLAEVPPVLLAECRHDYLAFAAKGAFDPEWERRSPW